MYSSRYCRQILVKLEFSGQVFGKILKSNLMKIRLVKAELFHADGQADGQTSGRTDRQSQRDRQTDMINLTFAFRNFAKTPK